MSDLTLVDEHFMRIALGYARRHRGMTASNPSVGCLIVKNNQIIGAAATAVGGIPHAETQALAQASDQAGQSTAYVTLEPCAHHGKTPPCVEALIAAKVARVVIAMQDPFSEVAGKGIARLKQAGVDVELGVCERSASIINQGFFKRISKSKPWVTLKLATSFDGKVALDNGSSQWVTGDMARNHGHLLRARSDAILTGVGTVLADDPMLTSRLSGLDAYSPLRVILDTKLRTPINSKLVASAKEFPTIIMTASRDNQKKEHLLQQGVETIDVATNAHGHIDLGIVLEVLSNKGVGLLMVESGMTLATHFMKNQLVDEIYWYQAPKIIGNDGMSAIGDMEFETLEQLLKGDVVSRQPLSDDMLTILTL